MADQAASAVTMERIALELLAAQEGPVGAVRLTATWRAAGIDRGEATAGRFLSSLDEQQLTTSAGSTHGRTLTDKGSEYLKRLLANERLRAQEDALAQALTASDTSDLVDLLVVRKLVEAECASLAALRATTDEREELLRQAHSHTHLDPTAIDTSEPSMAFHRLIASASHNRPLQAIAQMLLDPLNDPLEKLLSQISVNLGDTHHQLDDHLALAQAIANGDADTSRHMMETHVDRLLAAVEQYVQEAK